ncbi:MAG: hypothetical protein LUD68_08895 [Rikenellaceae bacterium]|nr:hypothetical protein [Rikenellaceae bacterium]
MRRNKIIIFSSVLLLGFAVYSCQQELLDEGKPRREISSFVTEAREFYELTVAEEPIFGLDRCSDAGPPLFPGLIVPNWEKPYIYETDRHRFLFARLAEETYRYQARQLDRERGYYYETRVFQAAVFARSLDDPSDWFMGMATFIPDRRTALQSRRRVLERYLDEPDHGGFSGKILFSRISDMAVYAVLVFENGAPVRRLHPNRFESYSPYRSAMESELSSIEFMVLGRSPVDMEHDMEEIEIIGPKNPDPPLILPPNPGPELPELPDPGGGGGGGGGGTTPTEPENRPRPSDVKDDCSGNQIQTRSNLVNHKTLFENIEAATVGMNNYIDYPTYQSAVSGDNTIEHSTSIIDYGDGATYLTPVNHGTSGHVSIDYSSQYIIGSIHNHPNGTPPSAVDIITTGNIAGQRSHYRTTTVYIPAQSPGNQDIYYMIHVDDAQKAAAFAANYGSQLILPQIGSALIQKFISIWKLMKISDI